MKKKRIKTKMTGLVSHNTSDGKSRLSPSEVLRKKFNSGTITKEELQSLCMIARESNTKIITINGEISFDIPQSEKKYITVRIFGKDMQLTMEEYQKHYVPAFINPGT